MHSRSDEGLANEGLLLSLLIYVTAVLGVLALFAVPVWFALQPTVVQNVSAQRVQQILAARRADGAFPVARLAPSDILGTTRVAELGTRSRNTRLARHEQTLAARARSERPAQRARRDVRHSVADVRPVGANRPGPFQNMYRSAMY